MSEPLSSADLAALNAEVKRWADSVRNAARSHVPGGELRNSIKTTLRKNLGQVERVSIGFKKQGAYLHVGAGRGYGGKGGSFYSEAQGKRVKVRETSIGRMGTGARPAVEWLTPEIERRLPELAGITAKYFADGWVKTRAVTKTIRI